MTTLPLEPPEEDRYSRLRLIPWWDQQRLARARVLVAGAGALGNEILKNLALLGVERVVVADLDRIELTNLSRTVLYRAGDVGLAKAEAAARAYRALLPGARIQPLNANILLDVGLGLYRWADVVLAGLDNREARLGINRACWRVNRPWIDGAIEGINGVARVFLPGQPPCYECTLGEVDWAILNRRMSCNLLAHRPDAEGKTPTTPTISSIIAGIEVQEAVKLLHGLPTLTGAGFVFEGLNHTSYKVQYTENPDCMSHDTLAEIVEFEGGSADWTLDNLLARARRELQADEVAIEFSRDVIHRLVCPRCGQEEEVWRPVGALSYEQGRCPADGAERRVETVHGYTGSEPWGERKLSELGLPLWDIFTARAGEREIGLLPMGDRDAVLGEAAAEGSATR